MLAFWLAGVALVPAQLVIAHRGASADAPENTLAAFRLAWEHGADGIEGDFRLTRDGRIVCLHDETTKRTAKGGVNLSVASAGFEELRRIDAGWWKDPKFCGEKIPTLLEVLGTVPERKLVFIEIKCGPEIVPKLAEELATVGRVKPAQVVIISFREDVVRACRASLPRIKVNWLTSYKRKGEPASWTPDADTVMATLKRSGATGLGTAAEPAVVDARLVARLREAGLEFHCWTIDEPAVAERFRVLGTDSITTNRPAEIRRALER